MDKKYKQDFTKDWELKEAEGQVSLYTYFDTVDYETRYAIVKANKVVYNFSDGEHGNNYNFFHAVCKINNNS